VTNGGPQNFLETNLLCFPQAKTASGAYGTAVHAAIERLYYELRGEAKVPSLGEIIGYFKEFLRKERLGNREYSEQEERGIKNLTVFYNTKKGTFKVEHRIEVNFKNQGVVVGGAHLTGKIDKIEQIDGEQWRVHDFKTGTPLYNWKGGTDYEKVKLYKYKQQIVFYKLLVENARDFIGRHTVDTGLIEFVEPDDVGHVIDLPITIEQADVERTKKLVEVVYKKIISLDFPDITKYPSTVKGIVEFENDLILEA
jgi:DNA helicase II / ATP-dependent DNA helicase PcrA